MRLNLLSFLFLPILFSLLLHFCIFNLIFWSMNELFLIHARALERPVIDMESHASVSILFIESFLLVVCPIAVIQGRHVRLISLDIACLPKMLNPIQLRRLVFWSRGMELPAI